MFDLVELARQKGGNMPVIKAKSVDKPRETPINENKKGIVDCSKKGCERPKRPPPPVRKKRRHWAVV